jgi:hypothetical protein
VVHPLAKCCWCGSAFVQGLIEILALKPWTCPREACWRRQLAHAMTVTLKGKSKVCRFVPVPRQVELIEALHTGAATYILIGGAAGGTKSRGLREIGHQEALKHPNFRVLLLRRTYKELDQTHLRDVELEAPQMGADAVPSAKVVRYPNGSVMQFGHCETAADAANYLSAEYDLIIFDELVTFEETMFLLISSRARSTKPGVGRGFSRGRTLAGRRATGCGCGSSTRTWIWSSTPTIDRRSGCSSRRSSKTTRIWISSTNGSCCRCRRSSGKPTATATGTSSPASISRSGGRRGTSRTGDSGHGGVVPRGRTAGSSSRRRFCGSRCGTAAPTCGMSGTRSAC